MNFPSIPAKQQYDNMASRTRAVKPPTSAQAHPDWYTYEGKTRATIFLVDFISSNMDLRYFRPLIVLVSS